MATGQRSMAQNDLSRWAHRDPKTSALARIIRQRIGASPRRLLVVGCGSGIEAMVLGAELGSRAVGVDLDADAFDPAARRHVDLQAGDATRLSFDDASFDFVFSYHALEHIPAYAVAISEMARVLRPGGGYCIGTPNRARLLGYLGSKDAGWRDKLAWNAADWKARLRGRFKNEYGAHAGFTAAELRAAIERSFDAAEEITVPYYEQVYRKHGACIRWLGALGAYRLILPSVYFIGKKK